MIFLGVTSINNSGRKEQGNGRVVLGRKGIEKHELLLR